jgi:hypothetical protein
LKIRVFNLFPLFLLLTLKIFHITPFDLLLAYTKKELYDLSKHFKAKCCVEHEMLKNTEKVVRQCVHLNYIRKEVKFQLSCWLWYMTCICYENFHRSIFGDDLYGKKCLRYHSKNLKSLFYHKKMKTIHAYWISWIFFLFFLVRISLFFHHLLPVNISHDYVLVVWI